MKPNEGKQEAGNINSVDFTFVIRNNNNKSNELSCLYAAGLYRMGWGEWLGKVT